MAAPKFDPPIPEALWTGGLGSHACRWQGEPVLVAPESQVTVWRVASMLLACLALAVGLVMVVLLVALPPLFGVCAVLAASAVMAEKRHRKDRFRGRTGLIISASDAARFGPEGIIWQIEWPDVDRFRVRRRLWGNVQVELGEGIRTELTPCSRRLVEGAASACAPAHLQIPSGRSPDVLAPIAEALALEPMEFRRQQPKPEAMWRRWAGRAICIILSVSAGLLSWSILFPWPSNPVAWVLGGVFAWAAVLMAWSAIASFSPVKPLPAWSSGSLTWDGEGWRLAWQDDWMILGLEPSELDIDEEESDGTELEGEWEHEDFGRRFTVVLASRADAPRRIWLSSIDWILQTRAEA